MKKVSLLTVMMVVLSSTVLAQKPKFVPKQVPSTDAFVPGWNPYVTFGGNLNFSHSSSVVGQLDGASWTIGATINSGLEYNHKGHQWITTFDVLEAFTYAPPLSELVKSADQVQFKTVYYYRLPSAQWTGPFALGQLDTTLFEGEDVRPGNDNVWVKNGKIVKKGHRIKLTESFEPLNLKEVIGWFARPYSSKSFQWQFTTGLGAYQVFADGQMALSDDPDTPQIEVVDLKSYTQLGSESGVEFKGILANDKFSYRAYAIAMIPVYNPDNDTGKSNLHMTNLDMGVKLSFKLLSWASLVYEFRAVRTPQLIDKFQLQNNLVLSFEYTPVKKRLPQDNKK